MNELQTKVMALIPNATSQCQLCGGMANLDGLEPHPRRNDVEWRSFACVKCGPIKTVLMKKPCSKFKVVK